MQDNKEPTNLESKVCVRESSDEKSQTNPNLVTWENDTDPSNPKNWPVKIKWMMTMILSGFAVLPPLSSTILSPAQFAIQKDLAIRSSVTLQICLSIFNLGVGFGPLIMGPLSENYGRYPIVIFGNIFFLAWNTAGGFAKNETVFIICRLFTGFGSTASLSVMGGSMGDLWPPEKRATAIGMATFVPLLGPAIGPIVGGFVTQHTSWRWILWVTSIADSIMLLIGAAFLRETYAPKLLRAKAKDLKKRTGNYHLHSAYEQQEMSVLSQIRKSICRPFQVLISQPTVQILCILQAAIYGTMFLIFYSFPLLWTYIYNESTSIGSLNYISAAVGLTIGSQIITRFNDAIFRVLKRRNNNEGRPEHRLPLLVLSSSLIGAGLVILGWTGQYKVFWLIPNIGNALFLAGTTGGAQICTTYTVDTFTVYAASAIASQNLLRSMASFGCPLFAPVMFDKLGWGIASTILGVGTAAVGLLTGIILWIYGPSMRERRRLIQEV